MSTRAPPPEMPPTDPWTLLREARYWLAAAVVPAGRIREDLLTRIDVAIGAHEFRPTPQRQDMPVTKYVTPFPQKPIKDEP